MVSIWRSLRVAALLTGLLPAQGVAQGRSESGPADGERVAEVRIGGLAQRVIYATPARPVASIVMLPGGSGDLAVEKDGRVRHDENFVVRTRAQWTARGYAVVIPDTIDDQSLRGVRSSRAYADLVEDLVGFAHAQAPGPVYLLGTSQGSIAAMNGAAHARPGAVAGLILTESVSRLGHSGETVFSADPQNVRVPALVVANDQDRCDVAPPADASRIAAAMTRSPSVQVLTVSGGLGRADKPCGSLSPHGYYGMEARVIDGVDRWIQAHR